jgi:hypothetical protein
MKTLDVGACEDKKRRNECIPPVFWLSLDRIASPIDQRCSTEKNERRRHSLVVGNSHHAIMPATKIKLSG